MAPFFQSFFLSYFSLYLLGQVFIVIFEKNLLTFFFCLFLFSFIFCILSLFFINSKNKNKIKSLSLFLVSSAFLFSCWLLNSFDSTIYSFQYFTSYNIGSELLNLKYSFGLDNISILFFVLSSFLIFLCFLFILEEKNFKEYAIALLVIEVFLLLIFSVLDLLFFYVFFEAILIPMYLLIGIWGSRERKTRAAYLFFFYTLCGSIMLLIGILYLYTITGTLNIEYLLSFQFLLSEQKILWICFFLSFASKIPMFPFHIWLPEAHVEAPTVGSVLLAGILLKLGVYGFIRFSLTLFPEASFFFSPLVYLLSIIGIIYASMSAIRQTDLKRIIAYSSIAHMNLVTVGIFSFNVIGIEGAILQSVSHGFVAGGMFLLIGILYDRYHSRFLHYYGGLVHMMPIYAVFLLVFTLANIAVPGTSSFVGEFLLLTGVYKTNILTAIISALSVVLCGAYSLWLYNRIIFGNLKTEYTVSFTDMKLKEFIILIPLFILIFFMGVYPSFFSYFLHIMSINLAFLIV